MKKIKILLVLFISLFLFSGNVLAASGSLSVSSNNVYVGDTFTVSVKANSMAAWNIHVTATGPVSGCVINQADATADAMDTNKTFTATCKATGEGTITVTLTGDVTSASDGNAVSISGSKSVKVSKKPSPSNTNSNKPSNSNTNTNSNKPSNSNTNTTNNNLSKNNNLKELSVEGYNLTKIDNNNYTLTVNNSVTSINVKAIAEDSKSRITGNGKRDLKVGENTIEVIVTSESGEQKKTTIKITRKSEYTLDDLNTLLNDSNNKEINIIIDSDTVITSGDISRIKDSKKKVHFNYYGENKNLIYSWIVDGLKVEEPNKILTTISYVSDDVKNISKLSNYADGLYASFKNREELPKGTIIKLYVGNKFEDGYVLNLYDYNNNELKLIRDDLNVKSGYVEFSVEKGSEYFISMSNINGEDLTVDKDDSSINIFMIIAIIEFVIIIVLGFICFKRKNISKVSNVKEDIKTNVNEEQTIEETIDEDSDDSFDSLE